MNHAGLAIALAILLTGCASLESPRGDTPWLAAVDPVRSDNDRLLDYYSRLVQAKPQALNREYEDIRKGYEQQPNDFQRIQLAMLMMQPGTSFRDDAAALSLLQSWTKDPRNEQSRMRPLAMMLQSHLLDMRKADEALQAQGAKLRDEQRRAEALQQKLEALLEMEMKMIEREQAAQPRKK